MEEHVTESPAVLRFFAAIGVGALVGYIIYLLWLYQSTPHVVVLMQSSKSDAATGDASARDSVTRSPSPVETANNE